MKTATIIKAGIFTTIQDLGRKGMRRYGISYSGAMDLTSAINANILCGNNPYDAMLECTYQAPVIKMAKPTKIAVTGVNITLWVNDKIQEKNVCSVEEGDIIKVDLGKGARCYIAFEGGIKGPAIQGSKATDTVSKINGQVLKSGVIIYCGESVARKPHALLVQPDYTSNVLHIAPGPEFKLLSEREIKRLLEYEWVISSKSNRMSYMFEGQKLEIAHHHMLSSPVLPATIQLPPSGLPIVLCNDAQTTGGYPRIAIMDCKSYQILTQKTPGEKIKLSLLKE